MIGSVSLMVNYFVGFKAASLDHAFLVWLYLLLVRKIPVLFQMAKQKCTLTNKMQERHPSLICFNHIIAVLSFLGTI